MNNGTTFLITASMILWHMQIIIEVTVFLFKKFGAFSPRSCSLPSTDFKSQLSLRGGVGGGGGCGKDLKCYWIKKQVVPFHNHPSSCCSTIHFHISHAIKLWFSHTFSKWSKLNNSNWYDRLIYCHSVWEYCKFFNEQLSSINIFFILFSANSPSYDGSVLSKQHK
mgnify:CR=1 FL=1